MIKDKYPRITMIRGIVCTPYLVPFQDFNNKLQFTRRKLCIKSTQKNPTKSYGMN